MSKVPSSEKVRVSYNWTWFKCIDVGEKFVFASVVEGHSAFVVREKVSARKFRYIVDGKDVVGKVGSIDVIVVRLDSSGNPDKVSSYTPALKG